MILGGNGRGDLPAVELRGVWKAFDRLAVLRGVGLAIRAGESRTIMGGSGTGKGVLLRLIIGLMKPDAGQILLEGRDIVPLSERQLLAARRAIAARYDEALSRFPRLQTPLIPEGRVSGYQSYVCLFASADDLDNLTMRKIDDLHARRNDFMYRLEEAEVTTRQGTHAIHTLGYYKNSYGLKDEQQLASYAADRLSVALPLYCGMTDEEFDYVIGRISEALKT